MAAKQRKTAKAWYSRKTNQGLIGLALVWIATIAGVPVPDWVTPLCLAWVGYGANNHLITKGAKQ